MIQALTDADITSLALAKGFKLKEQADGSMALNPYVLDFARALLAVQPDHSAEEVYQYRARWHSAWHHCGLRDYANFSKELSEHYETRKLKIVQ